MATVIVQAVASLDGFIARPDDVPEPIFDRYRAGDVAAGWWRPDWPTSWPTGWR
jgi:hypothetical protein